MFLTIFLSAYVASFIGSLFLFHYKDREPPLSWSLVFSPLIGLLALLLVLYMAFVTLLLTRRE